MSGVVRRIVADLAERSSFRSQAPEVDSSRERGIAFFDMTAAVSAS